MCHFCLLVAQLDACDVSRSWQQLDVFIRGWMYKSCDRRKLCIYLFQNMEWYFKKEDLVFHFIFLNSELSQYDDDEERRGENTDNQACHFFVSVPFTN